MAGKHANERVVVTWRMRRHLWRNRWHYFIKPSIKTRLTAAFVCQRDKDVIR